ncbi:uncharacterized protein [Asterias amurensis]|uniref:uncharacterized protein n=1 Tax=Asterias amurensis TaxID=7602 RepID=UPI003AB11DE8
MMQKVKQLILFLAVLNLMGINASVTSPEEGMSTGPCCPVSPAGIPGIPGNPGIPGHPGPYGPAGSKGDIGSPGDVGMHGATGDKGSDGLNGERGATGEPGQKGEQGVGQPGKQGPQGLPGIAGSMGERGVRGPVGQKGDCVERTQRVAFTVVRNTDFTTSSTSLPFDRKLFEQGTHFDLTTGTFTCNMTGIYVFMFSFLKPSSSNRSYATLVKNDNIIVRGYASGAGNYLQTSNSAVVFLQEGDRVFLRSEGSLYSTSHHHTSFSGFLLYGEIETN